MPVETERDKRINRLIGENIRKNRIRMGLTQLALAEVTGIGKTQIWLYENHRAKLSAPNLYKICVALSVSPFDILPALDSGY